MNQISLKEKRTGGMSMVGTALSVANARLALSFPVRECAGGQERGHIVSYHPRLYSPQKITTANLNSNENL